MFKRIALLLTMLLALAVASPAGAQEDPSIQEELPGLESAYARTFMADFDAMFESLSTPGAEIEFDEDGIVMVMTYVYTFDSDDNAEAAMDTIQESFLEEGQDSGLEESEVEDLGDRATMYSGMAEGEGDGVATSLVVVRDGTYVLMAMVGGGELAASEQQAQDIAQFMVDAEVDTDEVTLDEEGGSTGGAFDLMPSADDTELIGGLAPISDMDMLEGPASPEA